MPETFQLLSQPITDINNLNPCQQSFIIGSTSPDLPNIAEAVHYEKPRDLSLRLLKTAQSGIKDIKKSHLESIYLGWRTHLLADRITHPPMNLPDKYFGKRTFDDETAYLHFVYETFLDKVMTIVYSEYDFPNIDFDVLNKFLSSDKYLDFERVHFAFFREEETEKKIFLKAFPEYMRDADLLNSAGAVKKLFNSYLKIGGLTENDDWDEDVEYTVDKINKKYYIDLKKLFEEIKRKRRARKKITAHDIILSTNKEVFNYLKCSQTFLTEVFNELNNFEDVPNVNLDTGGVIDVEFEKIKPETVKQQPTKTAHEKQSTKTQKQSLEQRLSSPNIHTTKDPFVYLILANDYNLNIPDGLIDIAQATSNVGLDDETNYLLNRYCYIMALDGKKISFEQALKQVKFENNLRPKNKELFDRAKQYAESGQYNKVFDLVNVSDTYGISSDIINIIVAVYEKNRTEDPEQDAFIMNMLKQNKQHLSTFDIDRIKNTDELIRQKELYICLRNMDDNLVGALTRYLAMSDNRKQEQQRLVDSGPGCIDIIMRTYSHISFEEYPRCPTKGEIRYDPTNQNDPFSCSIHGNKTNPIFELKLNK